VTGGADGGGAGFAVVVPTVGRPSLQLALAGLLAQEPAPAHVVVVDDRPGPAADLDPLELGPAAAPDALPDGLELTVLRSGGRGPAAARNAGWRATRADRTAWVVTVDDDVLVPEGWSSALLRDLAAFPHAAAITGRIVVPQPPDRRPTDWERCTTGLQDAWWATADMAFRREALEQAGGFDERFPRAYREDADLAIRLQSLGRTLARGDRHVVHPVRPAPRWISVRTQRGNADDALMRAVHGRRWRELGRCHRGRLPWHAATVAAAALAVAGPGRRTRAVAASAWLALTADFARRRITPGPRDRDEVLSMLATSVAIPPAALWWRARGAWRWRSGATAWHLLPRAAEPAADEPRNAVRAVLFDRDGTLVHDVPYNGDPALVRPVPGARDALDRLRAAGLRIGLVSNQSGVARGLIARTT
jgi:GT2 family glycosyltransferase